MGRSIGSRCTTWLVFASSACSSHPCPQDQTTDTMTGHAIMSGKDWTSRQFSEGRVLLSPDANAHNEVLVFLLATQGGYVAASFRRPMSTGTYRFEDLVIGQEACAAGFFLDGVSQPPSCKADDAASIPLEPLSMTGTVDMIDDDVPCQNASCGWTLKVDLRLQNTQPAISIDVEAINSHHTIQNTCSNVTIVPNTQ